jgi:hypothetical protein
MEGQKQYVLRPNAMEQIESFYRGVMHAFGVMSEFNDPAWPTDIAFGASWIFQHCGRLLDAVETMPQYRERRLTSIAALCLRLYVENVAKDKEPRSLFEQAISEVEIARSLYPWWPIDPRHAAIVVAEEAGELLKAANELRWGHKGATIEDVRGELVQLVAMCIRFYMETVLDGDTDATESPQYHP